MKGMLVVHDVASLVSSAFTPIGEVTLLYMEFSPGSLNGLACNVLGFAFIATKTTDSKKNTSDVASCSRQMLVHT